MENKKENFKRISEARVKRIVSSLVQMQNLANSSYYEYSDEEIEALFEEIDQASNKAKEALLKGNERKRKSKRIVL